MEGNLLFGTEIGRGSRFRLRGKCQQHEDKLTKRAGFFSSKIGLKKGKECAVRFIASFCNVM